MDGFVIKGYAPADRERWDAFVAGSKNGTFLFLRDYMDYHADRFPDASLIALDAGDAIRAVLPATRRDATVISHEGLTYGGFVIDETMRAETMLQVLDAARQHLRDRGATSLVYKAIPHIYHRAPAEEDLYALFRAGAQVYRRDLLSVIDYGADIDWDRRRRERMKKASAAAREGVEVRESSDCDRFWEVLAANLERRHGLRPVHTAEEIALLMSRFPERIRLFGGYRGGELEAGALVYLTDRVCHVQYSASTPDGRRLRALDLVLTHLIASFQSTARYFDFGISTEQEGRHLNAGLAEYKEQFGARTVVHDCYRLAL